MNFFIQTIIVILSSLALVFAWTEDWPVTLFSKEIMFVAKRTVAATLIVWLSTILPSGDIIFSATITGITGIAMSLIVSRMKEAELQLQPN